MTGYHPKNPAQPLSAPDSRLDFLVRVPWSRHLFEPKHLLDICQARNVHAVRGDAARKTKLTRSAREGRPR
jgi:hypothetical protein